MADWSDVPRNILGTSHSPSWGDIVREVAEEETTRQSREHLGGTCKENTTTLHSALQSEGVSAEIVCGWLNLPLTETPTTPGEARKHACIHYWVEVPGEREAFVCELAAEVGNLFEPAVFSRRPEQYHVFD